jgi:hypothetical protein
LPFCAAFGLCLAAGLPRAARAQDEPLPPAVEILGVFLDCHGPCDFDYFRRTGSSYLDDWSQNRLILEGGMHLRVVRGLDLNFNAFYARVRDQLSLAKAGATDDEVLLQLKQLKTSYEFFGSIGLSYTFGSKFNNVVNPRFDSSFFDF